MTNPVPNLEAELPIRQLVITLVLIGMSIAALPIGFHLLEMRDPYVQQVLAKPGVTDRGYEIFQVNCAACHGATGDGMVGPSLRAVGDRKSRLGLIHQVISGETPPMPKFQPSPEVMADLLAYLESLK